MSERFEASSGNGADPEHVAYLAAHPLPRTPFDAALCRLVLRKPISGRDGKRDGRRAAMLAALSNRVNWTTLRAWRRGECPAPQWAIDMVAHQLAERSALDANAEQWLRSA